MKDAFLIKGNCPIFRRNNKFDRINLNEVMLTK